MVRLRRKTPPPSLTRYHHHPHLACAAPVSPSPNAATSAGSRGGCSSSRQRPARSLASSSRPPPPKSLPPPRPSVSSALAVSFLTPAAGWHRPARKKGTSSALFFCAFRRGERERGAAGRAADRVGEQKGRLVQAPSSCVGLRKTCFQNTEISKKGNTLTTHLKKVI